METATLKYGKSNQTCISWLHNLPRQVHYTTLELDSIISTNDSIGKDLYAGILM